MVPRLSLAVVQCPEALGDSGGRSTRQLPCTIYLQFQRPTSASRMETQDHRTLLEGHVATLHPDELHSVGTETSDVVSGVAFGFFGFLALAA